MKVPSGDPRNHPKGTGIRVADGHLHVQNSSSPHDVIAIYAPGKWLTAVVE